MNTDIFRLLKGVDLFSGLDDDQIRLISQVAEERRVDKEALIIREHEDGNSGFFLVVDGELEVFLRSDDGRDTILSLIGPGDFFGEMSLIDNEPRSASVKANTTARLFQIRRPDFLRQLERFPELSMALLTAMSQRLRKSNRQIGSLATLTVYGRVAGTLMNLIEERGVRMTTEGGQRVLVIRNRPTQQQLADMSGTTRETVSRILGSLRKKNVLSWNSKELIILDENTLRQPEED
jgi:CRP/FNR family cyclic AMP-dependent transcriptional regulator